MRVRIVPASLLHVGPLAHRMRAIDRLECEAFGRSPKQALRLSLSTAHEAMTALAEDGEPLCMFGLTVTAALTGKAVPWLLGTDRMLDYATDLARLGPKIIGAWLDWYPHLANYVAAGNDKAIALLRHWGAEIGDEPRMIGGVEFVQFRFEAAIQARGQAA